MSSSSNLGAKRAETAHSQSMAAMAAMPTIGLDPGADTGALGDGITSENVLTLTGTAEPNATVTILFMGSVLATTTADEDGVWSFLFHGALSDYEWEFSAQVDDGEGGVLTADFTVTIDTVSPARPDAPTLDPASDTGVSTSDGLTNTNTPTLTGTGPANTTIRIYEGDTLVASGQSDADGKWEIVLPIQSDGAHSYVARAIDAAGNETDVAPYTAGEGSTLIIPDTTEGSGATTTVLSDGSYVVSWVVSGSSGTNLWAQIYEADGALRGEPFNLNASAYSEAVFTVAAADGGFVATFLRPSGGTRELVTRLFDADGQPQGPEVVIASPVSIMPAVIALEGGGGLAILGSTDADGDGVFAQRIGSDGSAVGPMFQVNTSTAGNQWPYAAAALEDGGFVVTWRQPTQFFDLQLRAQSFDENGEPVGPEIVLDSTGFSGAVVAGMAGGGFLAVYDFFGQIAVVPVDDSGTVGTRTFMGTGADVSLTGLDAGGFVLTYRQGPDLYAQLLDEAGAPLGDAFVVSHISHYGTMQPRVTELDDGSLVFTWMSYGPSGAHYDVVTRRFDPGAETLDITIDTIGPDAPTVALDPASDTGVSASDGITNDNTPTLTGVGPANSTINIYEGDTLVASGQSGSDGRWQIVLPPQSEGEHSYVARAVDEAGNESDVVPYTYGEQLQLIAPGDTYGAGAPTVTVLSDGAYIVHWQVLGDDASSNLAQVYEADGAPRGDVISLSTSPQAQAVHIAPTADGGFFVAFLRPTDFGSEMVRQLFDAEGQPLGSEAVIVPAPLASFTGFVPLPGGGAIATFAAIDADGYGAFAQMIGPDGSAVGPMFQANTATAGWQWSSEVALLDDGGFVIAWQDQGSGQEQLRLQMFDSEGQALGGEVNIGQTDSGRWAVAGMSDGGVLVAHSVSGQMHLVSVGADGVVDTDIALGSGTRLSLTALADGGFVLTWSQGSDVYARLLDDTGQPSGDPFQISLVEGYSYNLRVTELDDGALVFSWVYTDEAAVREDIAVLRLEPGAETFDITIDTTAPDAPVVVLDMASDTGASDVDGITNNATPSFTGSAAPGATVVILLGDDEITTVTADSSGVWVWTTDVLEDGDYTFTARVEDEAGNTAETDFSVTIDTVGPDAPSTPVLDAASDTGSSDSDLTTSDTTPTLTGTGPADSLIRIYESGILVVETMSDSAGNWSIELPGQNEGEHSYTARSVDTAGNETEAEVTLDIVIDTTAPFDLSAGSYGYEGEATVISGADLWFEDENYGTVTFTLGTVTNGVALLNGVALQAGDTFTQSDVDAGRLSFLHDGSETTTGGFTFTVADEAGNTTGEQSFSIDIEPVNDAPALTGFAVNLTVTEGDGPTLLDADVTFTDAEGNFENGLLEIIGGEAEDVVSIRDQGMDPGQISFDADTGEVFYGGVLIGLATGGCGCAPLSVIFNADATAEAIEALIENLTYEYQGDDPAASRTLHLVVTDGEGATMTGGMRGLAPGDTSDDFFWYLEAFAASGVNFDGDAYIVASEGDGTRIYVFDEDFQAFVTSDEWTIPGGGPIIPNLIDLDGDGALDVMLSDLGTLETTFWRNTGSGFEAMPDPLGVQGFYTSASGDMDGDGDLDLIVSSLNPNTGEAIGGLRYFENVDGVLTERTGADNPLGEIGAGLFVTVGDMDGDGDMEVLTVSPDGANYYVDNGSGYVLVDDTTSPFYGMPPFPLSMLDIDGDGYADVFGSYGGAGFMAWNIDTGFAPITINVTPVNDDPVVDTNMGTVVGEGQGIGVTTSDLAFTDADNDASEVTYTLTALPEHGVLYVNGVALEVGDSFTQEDIDNGALVYWNDGSEADSDRFQFGVTDGAGGSSTGHSFGFEITPADDPVVAYNDAVSTTEHGAFSGSVFADNGSGPDFDPDGPALQVIEVNYQTALVGVPIVLPSGALLTLRADGTFDYDPNGAFPELAAPSTGGSNTRAFDYFYYTLAGGASATVTIEIVGEYNADDRIEGTAGADVLTGGALGDHFHGEGGSDLIDGGAGDDRAYFAGLAAAYTVTYNTNGSFTVAGAGGSAILWNVEHAVFDDVTIDLIPIPGIIWAGGAGDDLKTGTAYNDDLRGGEGNDSLRGSTGLDILRGSQGDDALYGQGDNDTLYGGDGNDVAWGGDGVDTIRGDAGNDSLRGENGADVLYGGDGDDFLYGGADGDRIYGGAGKDSAFGGDGGDSLWGDAGDDVLRGEAGDDFLYGGDGADILLASDGQDRLYGGADRDKLYGGGDNDLLFGEAGNDSLRGENGNDVLRGGDGDDFLYGGDGDDRLEGGAGIDRMYGGAGADRFVFVNGDLGVPSVTMDRVHDFNAAEGDIIDLSGIDANTNAAGDQAFVKVSAFTGVAGEYMLQLRTGYVTALFDTDGDGVADMALRIDGATDGVTGWVL